MSTLHSSLRTFHGPARALATVSIALGLLVGQGLAVAGGPADQPIRSAEAPAKTTDRFIVKLRDGSADARARLPAIGSRAGRTFTYVREMSGGAHVVRLTQDLPSVASVAMSVKERNRLAASQLMLDPEIAYAEPDNKLYPMLAPNDPLYAQQWNYFEAAGGINLPAAWDITTGSTGIVVAVIDTGILPHADLAGRTVPGYDFIGDTDVSADGDGRDTDPSDPGDYGCGRSSSWHGTHVSGTIGAASNNGLGVTGVNWVSKILPARVLGTCGGYTSDIVDAIRWSAGLAVTGIPTNPNPARVENMSLGGTQACSNSMQSAITDAIARGTVVVVAAGNENANVSTSEPANCTGVIAVGATLRSGGRASFSNFGTGVAVSAPGGIILSTLNSGGTTPVADSYQFYSGTSMASPHVAGVVSLMLSRNPSLTPAQVRTALQSSARAFPTGTGSDCTTALCGAGIVDAAAAVVAAGTTSSRTNLALASSGALASASSVASANYAPSGAINGDRKGANWDHGGGWNDFTANTFPDWIRVDFPATTTLSEIDVFSVQDNYLNPVEPYESMTFTKYGLVDFDVQYLDASSNWVTVPGGAINGNNRIWTKVVFSPISTKAIRVNVRRSADMWSRVTEIEAYSDAPAINFARSANGGVASATSSAGSNYPPSGAINGDRAGRNWDHGGGWNDFTANTFPDALRVDFNSSKTISEIDVFSVQDDYLSPAEPTSTMTFTKYGLVDFDVQYWNGSSWITVGTVNGNNLVWRKFTFPAVATSAIRVWVRNASDLWSRVAEVEAYGP